MVLVVHKVGDTVVLQRSGIVVSRVGDDKHFNRKMGGSIGSGLKLGGTVVLHG